MLDDASRDADFPSLKGMTYLNTAAEGIPPLAVGAALVRYFADHQQGAAGRTLHFAEWEAARAATARMFGLAVDEVGICFCTSEAFDLLAVALDLRSGDEVVINDLDFPSGRTPWLQSKSQAEVKVWRARQGALRTEDLRGLLGPRTRLVSTSLVSYFNGHRIDLRSVADAVHQLSPAVFALDVTQALGRVPLDLAGADFIVSSTHKWILATHGGGLIGIPRARAAELTVPAGGWFNLVEPFERDAAQRATSQPGAASYMVGMPNFPAIYAIRAALDYVQAIGVEKIDRAARPLVERCLAGLARLPVEVITPQAPDELAGIVAFRHPRMTEIYEGLGREGIQVMASAGRLRVSLHGYNRMADVEHFLEIVGRLTR